MTERSPEHPGRSQAPGSDFFPDSALLAPSDLDTEITEIADGDVAVAEALHTLDPDQVPEDAVKKRLGWLFWAAAGWFVLVVALAILAPLLESMGILSDPTKPFDCGQRNCSLLPPLTDGALMGTDRLQRDIFSRVVFGAQTSLLVGFGAIVLGIMVGATVGIIGGYFKGKVEAILMGIMTIILAFPALLLALAIVTFLDNREWYIIVLAIGIVAIPPIAFLVRSATIQFSQREFVLAARTLGASNGRIILKEILPNAVLPIISFGIIGVAVAIVAEGALAFLGLSVQPPTPTWGGMINDGRPLLESAPWVTLMPCLVLFLTVLSLNLMGDRLREYFDIREGLL